MTDLFSGLGSFFDNLFKGFDGGAAQPSQQPQKDAELFGQLFSWLPDGGQEMSKAFAPPREVQPWEEPPTIQSVQMRSYGDAGQPRFRSDPRPQNRSTSYSTGYVNSYTPSAETYNGYGGENPDKGGVSFPSDPTAPDAPSEDPKATLAPADLPGTRAYWEASRAPAIDPKEKQLSVREEMRRDRSVHWAPTANFAPAINDVIDRHATANGLDPKFARRVAMIESGGRPGVVTGSYMGLFQMSRGEMQKYGGGDPFNPEDNARAGLRKMAAERNMLAKSLGRDVSPGEVYLAHQQGVGGATKHLQNPAQLAWRSMAQTAEGIQKGERWARKAIWGNVPDRLKRVFGSVDNITSGDFARMWISKVEGK